MGGEINSRLRRHAVTYFGCTAARTVHAGHAEHDPPELDEAISNAVGTQKTATHNASNRWRVMRTLQRGDARCRDRHESLTWKL